MYQDRYNKLSGSTGKLFFLTTDNYEDSAEKCADNKRKEYGRGKKSLEGKRDEGGAIWETGDCSG